MKKIYNLLVLAVLMITGTMVSQAQEYYVADPSSGDNVTEIEEGVDYAIMSARYASSYLCGDKISNTINAGCLYQFVKNGTNGNGDQLWNVKRSQDNKYILAPENRMEGQADVSYTSMQDMACSWQIRKPRVFEAIPADTDPLYEEWVQDKFVTISAGGDNSWVVIEEVEDPDVYRFLALWTGDGAAHIWNYVDTNALRFVKVKAAENAELVNLCMADLCPNGLGGYVPGEGIGHCDQAALDEAAEAYAACEELVNTASKDTEACAAAAARLKAAMAALDASIQTLTPGYYYMVNLREGGDGGAMPYNVDGNSTILWNYKGKVLPEKVNADFLPYVWNITQEGGVWYMQNVLTGKYIGAQDGLSKALPATDTPTGYNINACTDLKDGNGNPYTGYFNIQNPANASWAFHTQTNGQCVVYWGPASGTNNTGSAWTFVKVDEVDLAAAQEEYNLAKVKEDIADLIEEAEVIYNSSKSYLSDATPDENFTDEPGILAFEQSDPADPASANVTSNATEPNEGSIAALFDSNFTTYFHSLWSATPDPKGYHYLQIDLGAEYKQLVMKYARRHNNANGSPTVVTIQSADNVDGPYTDELSLKTPYSYSVTIPGDPEPSVKENWGGLAGFEMAAPHRYIRIVVKKTQGMGGDPAGYPFFYWSEFRLYQGQGLDEENSLLTVLDKDAVQSLLTAVDKAKAALADGTADQATYDELKAAYDKFLEFYPEPAKITALLDEANELYKGATEGEGLGLYAAGSKEALKAAIDEVTPQVEDVMTLDEVNACVARMESALSAFKAALQLPEEGKAFFIESTSSNESNAGHRLYAENNALNGIKHGGFISFGEDDVQRDPNLDYRLNYMWTLTKNEDGTFAIRNIGTGYYMSAGYTANSKAVLQAEAPAAITLRAAPEAPGSFNFVLGEGFYANAQPSGALETAAGLVTWNVASGTDNSAFTFVEVTEMPFASYVDVAQGAQIITLPYEISSDNETPIYTVAGIDAENNIQFVPFAEEMIPAGTPFLLVNNDETVDCVPFLLNAISFEEIAYNFESKSVNGLTGTLQSRTIETPGIGMLMNGRVIVTDSKVVIAANSGFFDKNLPETTVVGDYSLQVVGGTITSDGTETGIENLGVVNNKVKNDVYTISGLKVRSNVSGSEATRNLPAGIYIVGGKKVLVK